jgi:hypothetical protein
MALLGTTDKTVYSLGFQWFNLNPGIVTNTAVNPAKWRRRALAPSGAMRHEKLILNEEAIFPVHSVCIAAVDGSTTGWA